LQKGGSIAKSFPGIDFFLTEE
jgi:hypothetical protein